VVVVDLAVVVVDASWAISNAVSFNDSEARVAGDVVNIEVHSAVS